MLKKVLMIEDSLNDALMVKEVFARDGLNIDIATTASEGYEKAKELNPDLILLDLILPDMSGFDLCAKIKKELNKQGLIIVILSIKDNLKDIHKAFEVGADDYVIKPPDPEFLVKKIKLYLGIR